MSRTVGEVMTPNPITVKPDTPLQDAIRLLAENRISGMPVLDDQEKLVGVISDTDLMWQESGVDTPPYVMLLDSIIYLQNPARHERELHKALGQTVGEVMNDVPISILPTQTLREAAHLMNEKKIRRLPVLNVESRQLIGILTQGDIIRAMARGEA
ncbi:IMP dehydrogenase [Synechocystis sp. PCC 6803]|jgi:CBS domain-containing protein|uniref:IMP dehydrogenase n=1 Tax=Synechocystis sp. (strain ATCC 27184 / PCC 6803 / Kazusa) TaxID=1111708 RepID=Q55552_SYNY3|nr:MULTISPECIES: CBS domain-containing protein [unclassified Synechocystis]BAM54609.1 photosystem I assembly protein [Synechocystis sp. PCC 6803] [Bacillus subtilis BEST7613]AGF52346.1 IMP dehydrogenase [Synechocystis sp. PCC 6803]ALJ68287.1 phosphoribulokinase [Synechocystis sp. PCC 6803]AVP90128.1 CBS domain-containing protein [Synechocystis sp. IPPAS B-1465]MBD2619014.1 CBS domain-containing protein [Synechocystis sp. FACHB-898]